MNVQSKAVLSSTLCVVIVDLVVSFVIIQVVGMEGFFGIIFMSVVSTDMSTNLTIIVILLQFSKCKVCLVFERPGQM